MGKWFKARKHTCAMLCIVAFCLNQQAIAQLKQTQFNGFGHLEYSCHLGEPKRYTVSEIAPSVQVKKQRTFCFR